MSSPDPETEFHQLLSLLPSLMLSSPDVSAFLTEVAMLASTSVLTTSPTSCGITTQYDHHPLTLATSGPLASLVDEAQYGAGDGPCLAAMRTGTISYVSDVESDTRWPQFRRSALEQGVVAVLSLPLLIGRRSVGALNLYGSQLTGGFDTAAVQRASIFADRASTALALTLRHVRQGELTDQLEQALRSSSVIDQALGVLMGQQKCDAATAFALLRQHSQNNNQKLRDVAADLIERVTGSPPVDSTTFDRGVPRD